MIRQMSGMMAIVPYFSSIAGVYGNKILWLGIFLLVIVIICNKPTIWEVIACAWAMVTVYISDNTMMLILMFLVVAARNIDKISIVRVWMAPVTLVMAVSIVLYPILHAQGDPMAVEWYGRWTFFFNHPNSFGLWFAFWILGIIYLGRTRMPRWLESLLLVGASAFLVALPQSKTAAMVLILGIPLLLLEKYNRKVCRAALCAIPILCIAVTVVLTTLYYRGTLLCNQYVLYPSFALRFQEAAINLMKCPPNLWGQKVYHLGQNIVLYGVTRQNVSMDNGIVAAIIYYGVILGTLLVAFLVANIFLQAKAEDERRVMQAILLAITFVMGMMEWPAWYGTIGFPMLFLGDWVRKNDKKKPEAT